MSHRAPGWALLAVIGVSLAGTPAATAANVGRQSDGSVLLPTNQLITPAGTQAEFGGRPTAVVLSPDGATAAFLNGSQITTGADVTTVDIATATVGHDAVGTQSGTFDGLAWSADGSKIYSSGAVQSSTGQIRVAPMTPAGVAPAITTISVGAANPNPGGLALSLDGATAYVALNRNNTLGVVSLSGSGSLIKEIAVGNAPHSVVLAGTLAYVTNEGGRPATRGDNVNDSSGTKIVADRARGAASTGTVSVVDLNSQKQIATIDVGLHPTALMLQGARLFVANTNSDTISVIDTTARTVVNTIKITPYPGAPYGSMPTGLAMLDSHRLLVTLGGDNALAVYEVGADALGGTLLGLLPTGWYPSGVAVSNALQRIVVANDKGVGALFSPAPAKRVQTSLGSASIIPFPTAGDLASGTVAVARNNHWAPANAPLAACPSGESRATLAPSPINHVVYIVKENRTYDQVMGDDLRGNGDPSQTLYGSVVTPNAHAIATQFPLVDNFYDSGSLSADGHQWVVQSAAPDYLEKSFGGFSRSYPASGFDALAYLPSGFIWEDALRNGKTVANFAEYANEGGTLPEHSDVPSNDAITVRDYPGFDLNFPDQQRADIFLRHFAGYVKAGTLANLTMVRLPNDHTTGTDPNYPTPQSQVADNDLALGRILDAISHSSFWKDTAVLIEEDDSQDGSDHVDGHRSVFFVASPYAKHGGYVDHTSYTQVNAVRTIETLLGLPPMNQFDANAAPMSSLFAATPDFTPFTVVPNKVPLDTTNPKVSQTSGLQREWALASMHQDFAHTDAADPRFLNRADWYATKGFGTPYPGDGRVLHPDEVLALPIETVRAGEASVVMPDDRDEAASPPVAPCTGTGGQPIAAAAPGLANTSAAAPAAGTAAGLLLLMVSLVARRRRQED